MLLSLRQLIDFNDEFADFFSDQPAAENIDYWECVYHPSPQPMIRISDPPPGGWVLFRKKKESGDTYLLIENKPEPPPWKSWFAPDPKRVLAYLHSQSTPRNWQTLFPLIRQAHKEAHPGRDETPNLAYLQDLITQTLHAAHPSNALSAIINELVRSPT